MLWKVLMVYDTLYMMLYMGVALHVSGERNHRAERRAPPNRQYICCTGHVLYHSRKDQTPPLVIPGYRQSQKFPNAQTVVLMSCSGHHCCWLPGKNGLLP